ncbi:hypothetical protein SANA_15010 [Gottschalkiaceae bacterium SANA]|nr:hypothetical protein SANA_15010 [Gottschalkiaceae bacterium SANA]
MMKKRWIGFLIIFLIVLGISSCVAETPEETSNTEPIIEESIIVEDGYYISPEDVGEYLHLYGQLPGNYLTKSEARDLGWVSEDGNLWEVTDQMSIGGDRFGNREGLLPKADGRKWFECDVNYAGGYRGAERVVFSNDGLVYYTEDHYESFTEIRRTDDEDS